MFFCRPPAPVRVAPVGPRRSPCPRRHVPRATLLIAARTPSRRRRPVIAAAANIPYDLGVQTSSIDPELLERLRRGIPLRLDRQGGFWHDGEPVTHPRVIELFRRGLDVNESGELQLHVGPQWCYLSVDDCPLRVLRVRPEGERAAERLLLYLDDARILPLDPATLWEEPEHGLRCAVPSQGSGRPLSARFTNTAQMDLAAFIDLDAVPRPRLLVGPTPTAIPDHPPGA